jgi:hypothetical protein
MSFSTKGLFSAQNFSAAASLITAKNTLGKPEGLGRRISFAGQSN